MSWYTKRLFTICGNILPFDVSYNSMEEHYSKVTHNLIAKEALIFLTQIKTLQGGECS